MEKSVVASASPDFREELIARLKDAVPEAFAESRLDIERLKTLIGDAVETGPERYTFSWAGKRDALAMLQAPTRASLIPDHSQSLNFDDAQHIFIEGENLECLKVLYRSYFGRVKMIYIDPPYNTGSDFIYPDNFSDPLQHYLKITGQANGDGNYLTSQPEQSGRHHSAWLSMMYPRIAIARQFLAEDGAIFVSINDAEAKNLSRIMDEIFGEENFISQIVWQRSKRGDSKLIANVHEYVLVYARNKASVIASGKWRQKKEGVDDVLAHYMQLRKKLGDDHPSISNGMRQWYASLEDGNPSKAHKHYRYSDKKGLYFAADFAGPDDGRKSRPRYDIIHPLTGKPCKKPSTGWRWDEKRTARALAMDPPLIHFGEDETTIPCRKSYLKDIDSEPFASVFYRDGRAATLQVEQMLCPGAFDFPKNTDVLANFMEVIGDEEALVLDFFAGSGSTAQAVFERNSIDNGRRRFILIQLPEKLEEPKHLQDGTTLRTIADVGRERISRFVKGAPELSGEGIRIFKLGASSVRRWTGVADKNADAYAEQLDAFADTLVDGWKPENVIWEVALREGYSLTSRIEKLGKGKSAAFWRVTDPEREQSFIICLNEKLTLESVVALNLTKNDLFVCRDTALDDTLAANLALQCRLKVL